MPLASGVQHDLAGGRFGDVWARTRTSWAAVAYNWRELRSPELRGMRDVSSAAQRMGDLCLISITLGEAVGVHA
jgi:hypothetical protein